MLADKFSIIAEFGHSFTLWLLILLSILSIAFILERWLTLRQVKANSAKVTERLAGILQSQDLKQIETLSHDWDSLEGRALAYGIRHIKDHGAEGLEEIFATYANIERPKLERFLNFLATVGSNAPFVGLLGTVFGIMDAFTGLAKSQGDATVVMVGISNALMATAIGLIVAIPAVIAYNTFQKQVKGVLQSLDSVKEICIAYAKSSGKEA
ncbi:MAG: MotA/TolQ/ExbB proton channel family protein [Bdellovibrionaceae bacterium]|jgi:biopolymer transport protein TolQ|nr:MotA/TolQ/ExbB proton channel family protein [Pseudobdellovibrionaceae bacterium]